MDQHENAALLSADKPRTKPEDDLLGYAPFAKQLARSILSAMPVDGLVAAIFAPWGSGKTTLLNFVEYFLADTDKDKQLIIVHFNPWWFSGDESIARHFFDQLQAVLSSKGKLVAKELRGKIANFADAVSELPLAKVAKLAGLPIDPEGAAKGLAKLLKEKQPDITSLKSEIAEALRTQSRKILVIIDDIDRLTSEEIRQLFRVIKAVADFPNVVYLVAFDKEVAIKALSETQGGSGEDYLEKIIQVPFELPLPDKTSLRKMLYTQLDVVLAANPGHFDQGHWLNIYREGIDHFIETPRDIIRLVNTLNVTFPAVAGEVNPVDFIAIETIRVFQPFVYDLIRKNEAMFTGPADQYANNHDQLKPFHNSWIDGVSEQSRLAIRAMMLRLFPKLESVWGNTYYGYSSASNWRRSLRLCSPDIFPAYFRLALPDGSLSNKEIENFLYLAPDSEAFAARLLEMSKQIRPDGSTRARQALERLEDYTQDSITIADIPSILQALANVGDILDEADQGGRRGLLDIGMSMQIGRIFWQLLRRLPKEERFAVIRPIFEDGAALDTIIGEIITFGQQHGKHGGSDDHPAVEHLLTIEEIEQLEASGLEKIRAAAKTDQFIRHRGLASLLYRWQQWGLEHEAREWVSGIIKNDWDLLLLLSRFTGKRHSQGLGDAMVYVKHILDPNSFKSFVDLEVLQTRVTEIAKTSDLQETDRAVIEWFQEGLRLRAEGKDPNSF